MRCRGFSLIELMVTIAVLAILVAIGFPSFHSSLQSNRVTTANNELVAALSLSRSEAIRNARGSGICPSKGGEECDGDDWSDGWIVWADENGDGTLDNDEEVLRVRQASQRLAFGGHSSAVTFDSRGRLRTAGGVQITLQPDDCEEDRELKRALRVNAVGQVTTLREKC